MPIGSPSSAVKPIVLSMLCPPASAHIEAPLPRWATITRRAGDVRGDLAQAAGDKFVGKPVKSVSPDAFAIKTLWNGIVIGERSRGWRWNAVSKQATWGTSGRSASSDRIGAKLFG